MRRVPPEAVVGVFVLAAFGLLLWGSVQVGALRGVFGRPGWLLFARFDDVAGLSEDTHVLVAGVPIGRVESIVLEGRLARVALRIEDPSIEVPRDSAVAIRSRGLLGEKVLEIVPGSSQEVLEPGSVLTRTQSAADVDVLVDRLSRVAEDAQQVSTSFRNVLGGPEGEEAVREFVANLRAISGDLRRVVEDNEERLQRIALNLEAFSGDARGVLAENRAPIAAAVKNFQASSQRLNASLKNLAAITERLEKGEGTLGRILSDEELYRDVDSALVEARAALREVRRAAEETQEQIPATILTTIFGSLF